MKIIEKLNSINFDYINNNYIASFKDLTEDEVHIISLPKFKIKYNDIEFVVMYIQEISMNELATRRYYDAELILIKSTKQLRNEKENNREIK